MLKYIIIALVFWFNPLVSNIDILPDIVGYLLIVKAFSKASYIHTCAAELCVSANKMSIISGVKVLTIFMVSSFDLSMSLLLSFSFAIIEAIFGIPFFIKLFDTVAYLTPMENQYAHANAYKMKRFTIIAFVARLVLAFLPDLTALSQNDALAVDTDITIVRFRPVLIAFSVFVALVICIVWLVRSILYFKKTITSDVYEKCNADFLKKTSDSSSILFAKKNLKSLILIIVGSLFVFDFTWEYTSVDIFQDFMLPLLALVAIGYLLLSKACKMSRSVWVLLVSFLFQIGVDIFEMSANISYFEKYNMQSMLKVSEAEDMYTIVTLSAILASIAVVFSSYAVLAVIRNNARESIVAHKTLFSEIDIDYYLKEYDARTKKSIAITVIVAALGAVIYSLSVALKPYAEWMVLLNIVFEILFIISFISAALYAYDEVYKRILTFA